MDRLLEGEQTGEMMCGHFACAVPDYGIRGDSEVSKLLGQGDLDGEVRGLRHVRFRHAGPRLVASEFVQQRPVRISRQLFVAALDALGEHREGVEQSPAHFPPLGPMPVQTNASRGAGFDATRRDLPAVGDGLKLFAHIADAVGDHDMTVVEVDTSLAECVPKICQRDFWMGGQMSGQSPGGCDERVPLRAEIGRTASGRAAESSRPGAVTAVGGSASTTCALVPPNPKELTPTMRRSPFGNGRPVRGMSILRSASETWRVGVRKWRLAGM